MHQNRLEYVKLKISVTDLGHFLGTVANLADVRDQIRAERFELEITRDSAVAKMTPEDQKLLDDRLAESRAILERTKGISTQPPPAG